MPQNLEEAISEINDLIRHGKGASARARLRILTRKRVPRQHAAAVAQLLRRADLASLAIRVLNPIVRATGKNAVTPTTEEIAEYAAALSFIGASNEALTLLRSLGPKDYPLRLLYEAFALMSQWDYASVIPILSDYVKSRGLTRYQRLVGKVNLAAALVHERNKQKATFLLREIVYETSLGKLSLLHGIALELSAQNSIAHKNWEAAEKFINQAAASLKETQGVEGILVRKWKAIVELMRTKGSKKALASLQALRKEAEGLKNWETVRDCDRYEAVAREDEALFQHVYFGTPFESFRQWMIKDSGRKAEMPHDYVWYPGPDEESGHVIDLLTGETASGARLKQGQLLHRLLVILASDFYRPFRLASIYSLLYPAEYFNPVTSPMRVHQATRHLRAWLEENDIPLEIEEKKGLYRLRGAAGCRLTRGERLGQRRAGVLHVLRAKWPTQKFSIGQVMTELKMPRRSTLRLLQEAFSSGALLREGKGAGTVYSFPKETA